ncbi:hypothetical protein EJD97_014396 [Solanum chilense]|uniref:Integrase zinc-binding domain-containing protein n=1 Tax=Solanum chilense TaxID=4083 RepID=A0A6N2BGZ4_SOLCI|nr:hypothetical protein EJD97_014396 [Solanum chilense]
MARKANVVVDALSRMSKRSVTHVVDDKKELVKEVHRLARLGVPLEDYPNGGFIVHHKSQSSLVVDVKTKKHLDPILMEFKDYEIYWWIDSKKDIAEFVVKCPNCQKIKAEHQRPKSLSQDIAIPTWKSKNVNMYFVVRLPRTRRDTLQMHRSRKNSYADNRRRDLDFEVGEWVKENLFYKEVTIEILDRQVKKLRNSEVASVKVLLRNHFVEGATWEAKADMKSRYPHIFSLTPIQS